jgi:primosomal protein N' (replication factor Y)
MLQEPVAVLTAGTSEAPVPAERVVIGTEAVLHQLPDARVVAFLDFDAELLAPRYRANEEAMALLARAARLVGRRSDGGRVVVQTRNGRHEVLEAAVNADPGRLTAGERARRADLSFPPATAMAVILGAAAPEFVAGLAGVQVMGPSDGSWLVRSPTHQALCNALAAVPRPPGRLRIEVDPLRL